MAEIFSKDLCVRFRHCDPAGIVFYPRYFEMANDFLEDWFAELGGSFGVLHMGQQLGTPAVAVDCRFVSTSKLGDWLRRTLVVTNIGRSSLTLRIRFAGRDDGRIRLEMDFKMAFMDLQALRAAPIPEALRPRIEGFLGSVEPLPSGKSAAAKAAE